jgi:NADH-quinone oxidoreductase subunit N
MFASDVSSILPELFLGSSICVLMLYGVHHGMGGREPITWLTLLSFLMTLLLVSHDPVMHTSLFGQSFGTDLLARWMKAFVLLSTMVTMLASVSYYRREAFNLFEVPVLLQCAVLGQLLMLSSEDLLTLYLAIELQSFSAYILTAVKRDSDYATEAGVKYFLLGAFASGVLLLGCSLVYASTGTLHLGDCATLLLLEAGPAAQVGMVFLLVGMLFKLAAAPFHMWSPDVYEGAPSAITAYFLITPKFALMAVVLRLLVEGFGAQVAVWQPLLVLSSGLSLLIGAFGALAQHRLKRMLAYSAIGHVGFLLAGVACASVEGVQAVLMYVIVYSVMSMNLFALLLGSLEGPGGASRFQSIHDLRALSAVHPLVAATLTMTFFSMAGIPPLAGFYTKAMLFFATMSSELYSLAVLGVMTSVVSCFYYIRLVKIMYFDPPVPRQGATRPGWRRLRVSKGNAYLLGITTSVVLFLMMYPSPLYLLTYQLSLTLCA